MSSETHIFQIPCCKKILTTKVKNYVFLQQAQLRKTSGNRKWREEWGENANELLIMQSLRLKNVQLQ